MTTRQTRTRQAGRGGVRVWLGVAALMASAAWGVRAEAASTLVFKAVTVEAKAGKEHYGRIYAGPNAVMTLGGHGWKSVAAAQEVARRLNVLAEEGINPKDIRLRRERRNFVIMAGKRRVVQVDRAIARVHRSSPWQLAQQWARNLRFEFARPYLSVRPVVVPVGENRTAPVRGRIVGEVTVRAETPVVSASWDGEERVVRVFGEEVGRTVLVVSDARNVVRAPVRSAKYAGRVAQRLSAGVTGDPASAEVVARAAQATVGASLKLEPGAWAQVRPSPAAAAGGLPAGQSVTVPVRVWATGEEHLSYHARPEVVVRHEAVPRGPVGLLMVSNSPERLLSQGLWFEGELGEFESARLLYHHVNGSGAAGELVVELWNLGEEMARVHVIAGLGGPTWDESWAGHRAAGEFLGNRAGNVGWVVPVPPKTAAPVVSQPITAGATASGLLELRALAPAELRVRLYLAPLRSARVPYRIKDYFASPLLGRSQYPQPRREVSARYVVGREWAFVTIGDQAASGMVEGDHLAGEYGVVYEIALELVNPTGEEAGVAILLESGGGPARGTLLIDGRRVEAAVLGRDSEAELARYVLAPGEGRQVRIETMPEGGSNYPVRVVVRPG